MNLLITIQNVAGELVADSREVAAALDIQHENFLGTVEAHRATIETEFGNLRFQTGTSVNSIGARHQTRFAYLTELQASFVATLSRNTPAVVRFKAWLVKAFAEARRALAPVPVPALDMSDPLVVAQLFVASEKGRREAIRQLEAQAPAVAFARQVETSAVDLTLTAVAKILNWKRDALAEELIRRGFLYRLDGRLTPRSEYGERGQRLFALKMSGPKGGALYPNLVFSSKGLARVARDLGVTNYQQPLVLLPLTAPTAQAA